MPITYAGGDDNVTQAHVALDLVIDLCTYSNASLGDFHEDFVDWYTEHD